MRILICAKRDLPASLACNALCRGLAAALDDAELTFWLSDVTRPAELADPDLASLKFFERDLPNRWIFPLLEESCERVPGAYRTFAELARLHRAELAVVPSLATPAAAEALTRLAPDLVVSIRFSHIFPEALIRIPRHGIVNVHPGELPHYAGLFTPFHQLLDGRERLGCSVHWIDRGIDTGPVLSRRYLAAAPERSLLWHVSQVYLQGLDTVVEVARDLERGRRPVAETQDFRDRHYHRLPSAEDFARFRALGLRLVDYGDFEGLLEPYRPDPASLGAADRLRA